MNSQYEVLKTLLKDPKINWIRVNYAGHAKFDMAAWFRKETGESVSHVKKAHFLSDRLTSSKSTSLLLTMLRDTGSRNEDGEYDIRSLMISSLDPETLKKKINVPEIQVAENFESYRTLDLAGLPVFPKPDDDREFVNKLVKLRAMEIVKKQKTELMTNLKKLLDKNGIVEQLGKQVSWENPTGFSDTILDEKGEKVKQTPTPSLGFQLHPVSEIKVGIDPKAYFLNNIVQLWNEIEEEGKKIKELMNEVRPYELGIMERLTDTKSPFMIGGIEFSVKTFHDKSYDWTEQDQAKVKEGTYKIGKVPKSRGRWVCESIPVPSTEKAKETEMVQI